MIGRIAGKLLAKTPPQVLVDAHGVGYEIEVPMSTLCELPEAGADVALLTHFVVREDAQLLYGFLTAEERAAFRQLIKISGIGPRIALAVLSSMSAADLAAAVSRQDGAMLTRVPGIGKKTAERLLLELKGKLGAELGGAGAGGAAGVHADVIAALAALGYSERETALAVKQVDPSLSVSEAIREALKALAR
ncbi:MAG: Holliday junction branch migration protein RuvA [Duodenibacillus sp.]|nr:Holliday junction branch migration protein RuvA [Duodenibacillus sp.]